MMIDPLIRAKRYLKDKAERLKVKAVAVYEPYHQFQRGL